MNKDTKYIVRKTVINIAIIIIGALVMFGVLKNIEYSSARQRQINDSREVLQQVTDVIENNAADAEDLTSLYHDNNRATLSDLRHLLTSGLFNDLSSATSEERTQIFAEIVDKSGVDYLFIMDENGRMLLSPYEQWEGQNLVDAGRMYPENLTILTDDSGKRIASETNESGSYYFYSERINENEPYWLVLGTDSDVLNLEFSSLRDIEMVLRNVTVGNGGFVFAIDENDNSFAYFKDGDKELTGRNAIEMGLDESSLTDGYIGSQSIDGDEYFCIMKGCGNYLLVCAALSTDNIYANNIYSLTWSVIGFVIVSSLCLLYALIVRTDMTIRKQRSEKKKLFSAFGSDLYYNLTLGKKIFPLMLAGVILIFGISYYIQTLLVLNDAVSTSASLIREVENREDNLSAIRNDITDYYENQFLSKAQLLSYLLEEDPAVLNVNRDRQYVDYDSEGTKIFLKDSEGNPLTSVMKSSGLSGYAKDNNLSEIFVYDDNGHVIATTSDYWYFTLSKDPADQSYEFNDVIDGRKDYLIQDVMMDDLSRESQYIAAAFNYYTCSENGVTRYVSKYDYETYLDGRWSSSPVTKHRSMLQISLDSDVMSKVISSTELESVVSQCSQMMMIFDSSDDHRVTFSTNSADIGKKAVDIGVSDKAFSGVYNGFQRINGTRYFESVRFYNGSYLSVLLPEDAIYGNRFSVAMNTAICSFIFIALMTALITLSSNTEDEIYENFYRNIEMNPDSAMFSIIMPSGRESMTKKAEARWDNKRIPWKEKTAEQKLGSLIIYAAAFVIALVLATMYFSKNYFDENSVIRFIISGQWDHGFNIFALTACCLVIVTTLVGIEIFTIPVNLVTSIFGTKSETIGHLIVSVLKYGGAIAVVFYCLYLVGFDSASLLASAGILSLVIGLGAQSLIKDIIAGIFIVFEGEFRVGDIVSIGGYRGQVLDIGLRTTKIMSDDQNIKIIKNNDVSGVINMTRVLSVFTLDFAVDFGESVERVENILKEELPKIFDRIDSIAAGPVYKGISKFDQKTITMSIEASCKERDLAKSRSMLMKELIDVFYRYGINIRNKQ